MMNITVSANWTSHTANTMSGLFYVNELESIKTTKVFFYCVIFIASLIGNSLVLNAALKDATPRKSVNHFIANISLANLLITVVYMPRMMVMIVYGSQWMVKGTLGLVLCKMVPVAHHACVLVSILSFTALSIDRFLYIVIPTKQILNKRKQKFVIPLMWFVAVAVRFPSLYTLTLKTTQNNSCGGNFGKAFNSTTFRKSYYTFLLIFFYALPLLLLVVFYSIIIVLLRNRKPVGVATKRCEVEHKVEGKYKKASRKTLKMLIIVTSCFVICWATYFFAQIAFNIVPCELRFWRFFLAHCNSAISPYLFLFFNKKFQQLAKDTLYQICCAVCEIAQKTESNIE